MAAIPQTLAEAGRSTSSSRRLNLSHGRGGAGNMGHSTLDGPAIDLETPTLKTEVYTTGRGGSGNMAKNNDPAEARRAQDVTAHPRRGSNSSSHVGRGGAANIFKPSAEEVEKARKDGLWEKAVRDDERGLADKGKDWLKIMMTK